MILYPKVYYKSVKDIKIDFLNKNNINAIILDVDNTILDFDKNIPDGVIEWCKNLKEQNIKFCILSNTNKVEKVKYVAEKLNLPYFYFAKKPLKSGFKKAKELLKLEFENIAAVGDQIMTDVVGANRCKMFSILVEPISEKDIFITKVKRPIEKLIINSYLSKLKKEKV